MNSSDNKCPTPEMILKYFFMELDANEIRKIEEHFSSCSLCTFDDDFYGDFIDQAFLSARVQKEIYLNSNADTFEVVAASSFDNTGISEVISRDGKYILKKVPYLKNEKTSLLVVKLINPVKQGRLNVYLLEDTTPTFIGSDLIDEDNKVCFEVNSDIELKNIVVMLI